MGRPVLGVRAGGSEGFVLELHPDLDLPFRAQELGRDSPSWRGLLIGGDRQAAGIGRRQVLREDGRGKSEHGNEAGARVQM